MSAREPITLPVKLARELVGSAAGRTVEGWTTIAREEGGDRRWTRNMRLIVRRDSDGQLFAGDYEVGLTENQETEPWAYENEAEFEPVERRTRTVEVVEYVALADQAEASTAEQLLDMADQMITVLEADEAAVQAEVQTGGETRG